MADNNNCHILIAEDSEADVRVMGRAFRKIGIEDQVQYVSSGHEALDFLRQRLGEENQPLILLLDLNLPGLSGKEVLQQIKSDRALRAIPVLVFSTSDDDRDVNACYALGANGYIKKPHDLNGFVEVLRAMVGFWLGAVVLPGKANKGGQQE